MPRKLRLEFPGACYHVINRGNYRTEVFGTSGAKLAFETCLFEACAISGWRLHAFVIMRNHFHLAVETPTGNLVKGMHWLQCTFATRFNRLRDERGHLFQGRYKALLVEDGEYFTTVTDYIHLNPVRAGLCLVANLEEYRFSSYWYLHRLQERPSELRLDLVLGAIGLTDVPAGWDRYREHLAWKMTNHASEIPDARTSLSRGWALGSDDFKETLIKDHAMAATARAWESQGAQEIREHAWAVALGCALATLGRTESDVMTDRKAAPWKVAVAVFLKERSQASNHWLSQRLKMGSAKYVSYLVSMAKCAAKQPEELEILRRQAT